MTSRIGALVQDADLKSAGVVERFPLGSKKRAAAVGINAVCSQLVKRRTPICPTAKLVSEEGLKTHALFPQPQTIHNTYREILNVWKDAYRRVMNINVDRPINVDHISKIDTSTMDIATGNMVEHLKVVISDLTRRCNTLKQIIDDGILVDVGQPQFAPPYIVVSRLKEWLDSVGGGHLIVDEIGIRTTRKTPVGTKVMDRELYDRLVTAVDEFLRMNHAKERATFEG